MCGRYALYGPHSRLRERFQLDEAVDVSPRYNIAPTTPVLIVRQEPQGRRVGALHRWGLLPPWAKDRSLAGKLINARAETVAEKPAFRSAFRRARCLIPASGFYEWQAVHVGGRLVKQPFFVRAPEDDQWLAFAGLMERWVSPEGEEVHSCCIITTEANARMATIHDRMPVILHPDCFAAWLDPTHHQTAELQALLRPCPNEDLIVYPVSRAVNSTRVDSPDLIAPV